ncbi:DUF982 domain-containing protein (plasmid) [Phyllobacterium sp. A18/5-2]|uniref:DUF982 domain-containing protein n=1 Tax=Phyllobacterium sp. A18/5-2 TaxID=2978392 RepID=UPI0021C94DFC|nr:DUF982 domain-containing protein [Phyllobacterium sp. A18/5-2]UXN67473.1 DUF982 domain-containing protein [Phyllobacterium sp. A18/5-2]
MSAFLGMRDLRFPCVTIETESLGGTRNISSVEEAADFLAMYWPIKTGEKFVEAKRACIDALNGRIMCTAARSAFIEAAKEADIYVAEKRP